jgi:hypothetical protein
MTDDTLKKPHPDAHRLVPEENQRITINRLKELLPRNTNISVTQEIVDIINNAERDSGLPQELVEEDIMSYMHLVGGMRGVGIKDLINAVKFCNLKRNYSNKEAWSIVFPHKYNDLVAANKQVDNHVSMYNGSKLVTTIDKEMLIPVSLQYAPYFHAAVKKQFEIMNGTASDSVDGKKQNVSPMVQHLAAKELATLTKAPEEAKLDITINPGAAAISMQQEMNDQLKAIVQQQKSRLKSGEGIIDVQEIGIKFDDIKGNDE